MAECAARARVQSHIATLPRGPCQGCHGIPLSQTHIHTLSLPFFSQSLSLSHTHTHTLLSIFVALSLSLSASQLEPTRAARVTSPLTGERRLGAWIVCIHRPRPSVTPPLPSLRLESTGVRSNAHGKAGKYELPRGKIYANRI